MLSLFRLEGGFAFLREPGAWLWVLVAAGVLSRLFLAVFTEGTYDVSVWADHAKGIHERGLAAQYHETTPELNHPPLAAWTVTGIWLLAGSWGIPFGVLLRAPLALVDLGTAYFVGRLFKGSRYRWLAVGLYLVHPLALILSAHHGNTDPAVALSLVLSVLLASSGRPGWAGVALGAGLWIKLPGLLAAPAIGLSLGRWRSRAAFALAAAGTAAVTYLPMLASDPAVLYRRVFAYPGHVIHTTGGVPVWGAQSFVRFLGDLPEAPRALVLAGLREWLAHNTIVLLVPLLAFAWLRRRERSAIGLAGTVAGCYAIVYGLSHFWSFQYLAWSLPFWGAAGPAFLLGATALAGGYVWALYAFLCGGPLLVGHWDFVGHPQWPGYLLALRDASVLFFAAAAIVFLVRAAREEWRFRRPRA